MMIEQLEGIDRAIVLAVNHANTPLLDEIMWIISLRQPWFLLYGVLIFLAFKAFSLKETLLFIGFVVVCIIAADMVSVHCFKNVFERYRPSHHLWLKDQLHFYVQSNGESYTGGQFGFVSSHAANFFAIATASSLYLNRFYPTLKYFLLSFGILIAYSRMYLGVHYLSDVLGGALVGSSVSFVLYLLLAKVKRQTP